MSSLTRMSPVLVGVAASIVLLSGSATALARSGDDEPGRPERGEQARGDGVVSAAGGDEVDPEQAEAEAAAVEAYRAAVRPVAEGVFDLVQPLVQADAQVGDQANDGFGPYVDVSVRSGAGGGLKNWQARLAEAPVPSSLTKQGKAVTTALTGLQKAVVVLAKIDPDREEGFEDRAFDAGDMLKQANIDWLRALKKVFPADLPSVAGGEGDRKPRSKGAYLLTIGRACGRAFVALPDEEPTDLAGVISLLEARAASVRKVVADIDSAPAPPVDAARVEAEIDVPLREWVAVADDFQALADGLRGQDAAAVGAAESDLEVLAAGEDASDALRAYGSEECALFVGLG